MGIKKAPKLGSKLGSPRTETPDDKAAAFIEDAAFSVPPPPRGRQPVAGTTRTSLDLPTDLWSELRHIALDEKSSLKAILIEGARLWLATYKKKNS